MAYEFLKPLFEGKEHITFDELTAALDGSQDIKIANLASGGYVDAGKYNRMERQFKDEKARADSLQLGVANWESKYNTDTAALNQRLSEQQTEYATRDFFGSADFTSDLVKEAVMSRFKAQNFQLTEGAFGDDAAEWLKQLKEANPGAFSSQSEQTSLKPADPPKKPLFTQSKEQPPQQEQTAMSASQRMKWANEHPGEPWPWRT